MKLIKVQKDDTKIENVVSAQMLKNFKEMVSDFVKNPALEQQLLNIISLFKIEERDDVE